jgi:hypothetical protein
LQEKKSSSARKKSQGESKDGPKYGHPIWSGSAAIPFLDRRQWNVALSRCKKGVVVLTQKTALEKNEAAKEWWGKKAYLPTAFTNLEVVRSVF